MKISGNKFTDKFALSSQNIRLGCELVVNQNASYAMNINNMSVNLRNWQGMVQQHQLHVTNLESLGQFFGVTNYVTGFTMINNSKLTV
jgi:hypothetical protein